jgi:predicted small metal-binding protein
MAKTVGCSDFNQPCEFRVTAGDDQVDLLVDLATAHALEFHPEFEPDEDLLRDAIRDEVKLVLTRASERATS